MISSKARNSINVKSFPNNIPQFIFQEKKILLGIERIGFSTNLYV